MGAYKNLNDSFILANQNDCDKELRDHGCDFDEMSIYFRSLDYKVINNIKSADVVFGCVAWLTHFKIIDALSIPKFGASIVVQKEDFLKPDIYSSSDWKLKLREKYNNVKCSLYRHELPEPICYMSICSSPIIEGIRCVGNCNKNRKPSFPRMHNKFLVFAKVKQSFDSDEYRQYFDEQKQDIIDIEVSNTIIIPYAVWTGSLNFSVSSTMSFENAVLIKNKDVAELYFKEFCQILALSEPLDWDSEWMIPEWRMGT